MKRRHFLAAAAALLTGEAFAAPKKKSATSAQKKKPAAASSSRSRTRTSSRNQRNVAASDARPSGPVTRSADNPVIDSPPQGTSASRLPPVRAQELPSEWRTFEITTTVNLRNHQGPVKLWLPIPFSQDTLYQRTLGHSWHGNTTNAGMRRLPDGELEVFHCEWRDAAGATLRLTTHVTTADRHFDVTKRTVAPERDDILRRSLQASRLIPNDGLVQQLGERIVGRIKDPVAQAKAIYDWVIDNSIYDPALPGCGSGDVHKQLMQGRYGGRSADINGLFVALCRSIGIPARCVYGLRTGGSRLFRSLGLRSDDATRAQHIRAEFYIPGYGWIPVDPSDVRRAISREVLSEQDSRLGSLKRVLFGVWEMNWIAYNVGNDIRLPEHPETLPFLLFPQLYVGGRKIDDSDPANTPYLISARQVEL